MAKHGVQVSHETIVGATIISASSSTKNRQKARNPKMHQTKKEKQWDFGMKVHIGRDSRTTLIHSVRATAAMSMTVRCPPKLPHGQETRVGGCSVQRRTWRHSPPCPQSQGFRTDEEAHRHRLLRETERTRNRTRSKIQTKVEHAFLGKV